MWANSEYKKKREKELHKNINKTDLQPEADDLCIMGTNFGKKKLNLTEKKLSYENENNQSEDSDKEIFKGIQIGDTTITSTNTESITQKYYVCIDYYIPDDGVIKHQISLKNIGNVVIRYTWKRVIKKNKLSIIPVRNPSVVFCFKKSETVLLLNESKSIDIYFQIDKPGFYTETWELQTVPVISPNVRFVLVLWAFAEFANYKEICQSIRDRIDEGAKQKIVDDVIVSLLSRVHVKKPEEYLQKRRFNLSETNLFNAINLSIKKPLKPTICYYETHISDTFKTLYKEYRRENDPEEWNLDLNEIKRVINNIEGMLVVQLM